MNKIIKHGYKVDFHIHSALSSHKDGKKVNFCTKKNIHVLVERLIENKVNICSISDHDKFDYDLYMTLKEYEKSSKNIIKKVLPAVEFSVHIEHSGSYVVHVIAIFDDGEPKKLKYLSDVLVNDVGKPDYDFTIEGLTEPTCFSEKKLISMLDEIDMNVVLVAHQKQSLSSKFPPKPNDILNVGDNTFDDILYSEYFESYEFRNKRNELFNKHYLFSNNLEDNLRMITGSDCHDWRVYPKVDEDDKSEYVPTYLKCLPTYRGVKMAFTDYSRIKRMDSFFNTDRYYLDKIEYSIDGDKGVIPLSKGINVIIGDNSVGKSLLISKLIDYEKDSNIDSDVQKGYEFYLNKYNTEITTRLDLNSIFQYDSQGNISSEFRKPSCEGFLKKFYPQPINKNTYKEIIDNHLNMIFASIEKSLKFHDLYSDLQIFNICLLDNSKNFSLVISDNLSELKENADDFINIKDSLVSTVNKLKEMLKNDNLFDIDKIKLGLMVRVIENMTDKYNKIISSISIKNKNINLVNSAICECREWYFNFVDDNSKIRSKQENYVSDLISDICNLISLRNIASCLPKFDKIEKIVPITEYVHEYAFNSMLNIEKIDQKYFDNLIYLPFKKDSKLKLPNVSLQDMANSLKRFDEKPEQALSFYKKSIYNKVNEDLNYKFTITKDGTDKTQKLSSGLNSKLYFDLLSHSDKPGIYIVDQPEDDVSQKSIKEFLLKYFKKMADKRQVILITHNPQFVVNLDADNIIYLRNSNGKLQFMSGALEYYDNDYSVIDLVSENLDGGIETIRNRWKRYEKRSNSKRNTR